MENPDSNLLDEKLNSALNLMRRMPPSSTENSLAGLLELAPELTDDLLTHVDQPLKVELDTTEGVNKYFVLCDYNRDGDSYRSPWSNTYFPPMEDGFKPNDKLRKLEILANDLFATYRKLYFNNTGHSSSYFFETDEKDDEGFGACFLVHKDIDQKKTLKKGIWDSIHVFEVKRGSTARQYIYKLTTTVMITLLLQDEKVGTSDLSGLRTQQRELTTEHKSDDPALHIPVMGKMLEDCETRIRNALEKIYIQKTREVINGMRVNPNSQQQNQAYGNIIKDLNAANFHKNK